MLAVVSALSLSKFVLMYGALTPRPTHNASETYLATSPNHCAAFCDRHITTCSMARFTPSSGQCILYHWTAVGTVDIRRDTSEVFRNQVIIREDFGRKLVCLFIRFSVAPTPSRSNVNIRFFLVEEDPSRPNLGTFRCMCRTI